MNAYENWERNRALKPRSAAAIVAADVVYLVETGRMEMPDNLKEDFLYHWQDKVKYGDLCKKAMREDGIYHLDSRFGMHQEAAGV